MKDKSHMLEVILEDFYSKLQRMHHRRCSGAHVNFLVSCNRDVGRR